MRENKREKQLSIILLFLISLQLSLYLLLWKHSLWFRIWNYFLSRLLLLLLHLLERIIANKYINISIEYVSLIIVSERMFKSESRILTLSKEKLRLTKKSSRAPKRKLSLSSESNRHGKKNYFVQTYLYLAPFLASFLTLFYAPELICQDTRASYVLGVCLRDDDGR